MTSLWQSLWGHILSCPDGIFLSPQEIIDMPEEEPLTFLCGEEQEPHL